MEKDCTVDPKKLNDVTAGTGLRERERRKRVCNRKVIISWVIVKGIGAYLMSS